MNPHAPVPAGHPGDTENPLERWRILATRNLAAYGDAVATAGGNRTFHGPAVWAADAGSPSPIANRATILSGSLAHAEAVADLRRFYRQRAGGPWMLWSAWPLDGLATGGLHLLGHPPLMVRPAGLELPPRPSDLRIVEAQTPEELGIFERVLIQGYPFQRLAGAAPGSLFSPGLLGGPLRFLLGYVGNSPVAVAASFQTADSLAVYSVATVAEYRGRGYGAAMTAQACLTNHALPAMLQSSDLGRGVYERMGFEALDVFSVWAANRS